MAKKPVILITRAMPQAVSFAQDVHEIGFDTVIQPLSRTEIVHGDFPCDIDGYDGLVFTSANALAALTDRADDLSSLSSFPVYAVGPQTAAAAAMAGFTNITEAAGTAESLETLLCALPSQTRLLYVSADYVSYDFDKARTVITLDRQVIYKTIYEKTLPQAIADVLIQGKVDVVCFFSSRAAQVFADLVGRANLTHVCRSLQAVCISTKTAHELEKSVWQGVRIADHPTRASMLKALQQRD